MGDIHTDTIEGTIGAEWWFHYDVVGDVLYLRLANHRETRALGEETDDGQIILRSEEDDMIVGVTIVNWWERFGDGELPDSIRAIEEQIRPWPQRIAA